ncbi:hypothetical protein [Bradyrhizobium prioriisuperbiae]|uniref:hypothetical protein n=1 Tax=Bradyrhizobium prioriisuperbiae TaxID=2854389 RepID=UPI0028F0EB03|nr:hypothetical protein [Bradyrhizobium prioritasuperba]
MAAWLNDPDTVAAIVRALRHVHGDINARYMLTNGTTLAVLLDSLLRAELKNTEVLKLISRVIRSGDFIVTPELSSPSHLTYIYERPGSLRVADVAIVTMDHGTVGSSDIRLRLPSDEE